MNLTPQQLMARCWADGGCDIRTHLPFLFEHAHGDCMEIGTRWGASTSALLSGLERQGGHLWSVDMNLCLVFPGHPQWTFIHAHTVDDQELILATVPEELDLLFIDGDHSYASASADLALYGPLVRTTGLILMHDVDLEGAGVRQALEDYAGTLGLTPTYREGSYGLGVLYMVCSPASDDRRTAMANTSHKSTAAHPSHEPDEAESKTPTPQAGATYTNVYGFRYYAVDRPQDTPDLEGTSIAITGPDADTASASLRTFLAAQGGGNYRVLLGTTLHQNVLVGS